MFPIKVKNFSTEFTAETIRPRLVVLEKPNDCKVEGDSGDAVANPSFCFAFHPSTFNESAAFGANSNSELDCCWTADHSSTLPGHLVGSVVVHPNSTMYLLVCFDLRLNSINLATSHINNRKILCKFWFLW